MRHITIIGCGVAGLTCGVVLAERGYRVEIVARDLPPATVSSVAAAIWFPYRAYPEALVNAWGRVALDVFRDLAAFPDTGVSLTTGYELFEYTVADPDWRTGMPGFRRTTAAELPAGYGAGFHYEVPVIAMPTYLAYLLRRFGAAGGVVRQQQLTSVEAAFGDADALVNCSGLGARELVGDTELVPIRGQVQRVAQVPGVTEFVLADRHERDLTYIVPRGDGIILGGTAHEGLEDTSIHLDTAAEVFERCAELEPRLRGATVLEHKVGLRPGRATVRLEAETRPDGRLLVHNYGHGGAGVTLSWGCAEAVAAIIGTTTA